LTRYMGDWMTPQDFALLKSSLGNNAAKDAFSPGGTMPGTSAAPAADLATASGVEAALGAIGTMRSVSPTTSPRENPFLQGLATVGSPATLLPPPSAVPASPPSGSASIFVAPPPPPEP